MWIDQQNGFGPLYCAVVVFLIAFIIASAITDVFRCCIDTIFVCAFKDLEEHTPPKFMSTSLRNGFGLEGVQKSGATLTKGEGGEDAAL